MSRPFTIKLAEDERGVWMKFFVWLASVIGVEAVGGLSSFFAGDIDEKYRAWEKPPLSPPGEVFGIVWAILYAMMGTSLFLIIQASASQHEKHTAYILFAIQLILNFVWSILFFGSEYFWLAIVVNFLLVIAIFFCILQFFRINPVAAWLLIPYLVWCCFATYLAIGVVLKN